MKNEQNNNVKVLCTKKIQPKKIEPTTKNKKKKKKHIFGKILLTFFIVFIVLPIGLVYALCYTNKWEDIKATDETTEEIFNRIKVDSLDYSTSAYNPRVQLRLTQDDLNGFLKQYTQEFTTDNPLMKFVNNFYIKIEDNQYEFVFEIKTKIFCTKLILQAEFQEIGNREDYTKSYFDFKIKTLKVGRLSGFDALIIKLVNSETITSFFNDAGISAQVDLENKEIKYYEKDLIEDIKKQEGFEDDDLYFSVVNDALQRRMLKFDFNSDNSLTVSASLKDMKYNDTYCDHNKELGYNFSEKREMVVQALNEGIINEDNAGNLFDYLIHGYEFAKQDNTVRMQFTGDIFKTLGIDDVATYEGYEKISILNHDYATLDSRIANSVDPTNLATGGVIASLNENDINNFIRASEMIGVKSLFMRKTSETEWKANYVAINDFYCDIVDNGVNYVVGIDINGYNTVLSFVTTFENIEGYKLSFNTDKVYYGNTEATESMKIVILSILESAINADATMGVEIVNNHFIFDFASGIEESGYGNYIDPSRGRIEVKDSTDGNGRINFLLN